MNLRFKSLPIVFTLLSCTISSAAERQTRGNIPGAQRLPLWHGRAPIGSGQTEDVEAWITVHRPQNNRGTAIVICPGGGYRARVMGPEGHDIANWLGQHGITGVVLEYRLPRGRPSVPLSDAQRALRTVRMRAKEWNINPSRIGIMGFSAGGHLASTAGTHFDSGDPEAADLVDRMSCRPDFMILVYPVITMSMNAHRGSRTNLLGVEPASQLVESFSNETQVTEQTPPTFLAHARDDKAVPPVHSRMFHAALRARQVPTTYLELPSGGHGLDGYQGPQWDAWQSSALTWLSRLQLVPPAVPEEEQ